MIRRVCVLLGALALAMVGGTLPSYAAQTNAPSSGTLVVRTVPSTPGARVAAEGRIAVAGANGRAHLHVANVAALDANFHVLDTRVAKDRQVTVDRIVGSPTRSASKGPLVVGLRTQRLVHWRFVDRGGREVPTDHVSLLEMRSNTGEVVRLTGGRLQRPTWMAAGRTQQTSVGLVDKPQYWSVTRVVVDGADVVNRGQQVFVPDQSQEWTITLLFYRIQVVGRDLLFGSLAGNALDLYRPDGQVKKYPFIDGKATVSHVPRGNYNLHVIGPGQSFTRPISISKDQLVEVEVITTLDMALIVSVLVMVALSLLIVGRRHLIIGLARRLSRRSARSARSVGAASFAVSMGVVLAGVALVAAPTARAADLGTTVPLHAVSSKPPPTFAYYYIWYQPTSWQRAKKDYPLLGRYSSDDPVVQSRHVMMAKAAGLTGFLVSWKGSNALDARLDSLVRTARRQDFKLEIVYQGLDFERNPLPVAQIAGDLKQLADRYADDPVFDTFSRPVVVLTGTEKFSVRQLREATRGVRDRLLVLSSAKSVADYRRTDSVLDGDAYYWSSTDPSTPLFAAKTKEMSQAVHADGGLWFAPAPAAFDARLIGGKEIVPPRHGRTLQTGIRVARESSPDAVAVISWNEFSENSHVEPSQQRGDQELRALAATLGGRAVVPAGLTPTDLLKSNTGLTGWGALIGILFVLAFINVFIAMRRRGRGTPAETGPPGPQEPPEPRGPPGPPPTTEQREHHIIHHRH